MDTHEDFLGRIRYPGYHDRIMSAEKAAEFIKPETTLGCGSWGNNSISENLNYTHLINVSQIGLYNKDAAVPTDEEIWG